jgi:hypothetical protein
MQTNGTCAHHAQGLSVQVKALQAAQRKIECASALNRLVDFPRKPEYQRESVLGHGILSIVWNMAYCDASLSAGLQVYVVVASGTGCDQAQTRKSLEHLLRDAGIDKDRNHIAIGVFGNFFGHQWIVVEAEPKGRKPPSL